MIFFVDKNTIKILADDGGTSCLHSDYLRKFERNLREIHDSQTWKTTGAGAAFVGASRPNDDVQINASVSGIAVSAKKDWLYYSAVANETSGILCKSIADPTADEAHIYHTTNASIGALCCVDSPSMLLTSSQSRWVGAIASFDFGTDTWRTLTGGDSLDENPSYAPVAGTVLYNSKGIARDANQAFVAYAPSVICSLNMEFGQVTELVRDDRCDLLCPREAGDGALYYIRKPYHNPRASSGLLLDLLLLPVRLLKAIFGFLNAFTTLFAGEKLRTTSGDNPAKSRTADQREMLFRGNIVRAERRSRRHDDDPERGLIPSNWVLVRREGTAESIVARGVGCYCLGPDGTIYYSNGRCVFSLVGTQRKLLARGEFVSEIVCVGD